MDGVLSEAECNALIEAAEKYGFEHQSSKGASAGEVCADAMHRLAALHALRRARSRAQRARPCFVIRLLLGQRRMRNMLC